MPKYRRKKVYGRVKKHVGEVTWEVCQQQRFNVVEGHLLPDQVHMRISSPPKQSIAPAIGLIERKSAVCIHGLILHNKKVIGLHLWSRGYCVRTMGLDEETTKKHRRA